MEGGRLWRRQGVHGKIQRRSHSPVLSPAPGPQYRSSIRGGVKKNNSQGSGKVMPIAALNQKDR